MQNTTPAGDSIYLPHLEMLALPAAARENAGQDHCCGNGIADTPFAVVLCDGAGTARMAGLGAARMAESLCKLLIARADYYAYALPGTVRREVFLQAQQTLDALAAELGAEREAFASTLVALAVWQKTYIGLHLGDGRILCKRSQTEPPVVLSYPENGCKKNETYLTCDPAGLGHLRFFRGELCGNEQFALLTDGADPLTPEQIFAPAGLAALKKLPCCIDPADDVSIFKVCFGSSRRKEQICW